MILRSPPAIVSPLLIAALPRDSRTEAAIVLRNPYMIFPRPMNVARINGATILFATLLGFGQTASATTPAPPMPWAGHPVHFAVSMCSLGQLRDARAAGRNPNERASAYPYAPDSVTPLHLALTIDYRRQQPDCSRMEAIRELLQWGASLDGRPIKGAEIPQGFAWSGTPEVLRFLLAAGMRIGEPKAQMLGGAIAGGNIDLMVALMALGISPDAADREGCPAFYRATQSQVGIRYTVFQTLLAAGANPNAYCRNDSVLHRVAAFPDPHKPEEAREILQLLIGAGADPNQRRRVGKGEEVYALTPLEAVVESTHSNVATARLLLAHGAKLTDRLLFIAAERSISRDRAMWIDFLADQGLDLNAKGNRGVTPLLTALRWGKLDAASALLKRGADPRVKTDDGYTALHLLSFYDREAEPAIALLAPYKLDPNAKAGNGLTPLLALSHAHAQPRTIAALLRAGADVRATDANGRGIAHRITENANVSVTQPHTLEALRVVAQSGGGVDGADAQGNTPLMSAVRWRQPPLVRQLLAYGANPNARNRHGLTPLHFAAFATDATIIQLLLDAGARKGAVSNLGERPYDVLAFGLTGSSAIAFSVVNAGDVQGQTFNVETSPHGDPGPPVKERQEALKLLSGDGVSPLPQSPYGPKPDVKSLRARFAVP